MKQLDFNAHIFEISIVPPFRILVYADNIFSCENMISYPAAEGGTPLNNPPIEKHANSSMFALMF